MKNNANEFVKNCIDGGCAPGAVTAYVTLNDASFYAYGKLKEVDETVPVTVDTLYDLASCTKVVATTTMVLKLMEEGLITLDTEVDSLLEDFPYHGITIKHLLTHTSGMYADNKRYKECKDKEAFIKFMYSLPLHNEPGTVVEYTDFGFIVLGLIIEHFKGSLEEYANEVIFKPLNMDHTMYNPLEKGYAPYCAATEVTEQRGVIQGIVHDGKGFILNGLSGNAGLFSNAVDLAKFARMLLNDGYPVLKKETVDMLKCCYTDGLNLRRTLGWFYSEPTSACGSHPSEHSIFHTGFSGTSIYIDFDRMCAVIILTNRVHPVRRDVALVNELRNGYVDRVLEGE